MIRRTVTLTADLMLSLALSLTLSGIAGATGNKTGRGPLSIPGAVPAVPIVSGPQNLHIPNTGLPGQLPASALPGAAPALVPAAAVPSAAAAAARSAIPFSSIARNVTLHLDAIASSSASDGDSVQSAREILALLQGGQGAAASGDVNANAAPAAAQPRRINARATYTLARSALAAIADHYGLVYSMPQAGPKLTEEILAEAGTKTALLSDIDDTLSPYNTLLEASTVEKIVALRNAGKTFAAITDRPDKTKPGSSQMSAIESFSAIPADQRQGIILATNGGGKIYEYDAAGEPKLIFEEPQLPQAERDIINAAAAVVKSKLAELGSGLRPGPEEAESHGPYGYSMILQAGTPEAVVKRLAHMLEAEMSARGLSYQVEGRMAKNPELPPYITFSKLNKSLAVKRIAEIKNLNADNTALIGDSMYAPQNRTGLDAEALAAKAFAEWLTGKPMALTGNATDRKMELGLPGAMTLSVGTTGDPRMTNGWVLDGKGPEVTRKVLDAMASAPAGDSLRE